MARPAVFVTRPLPGDALKLLGRRTDLRVWEDELPPPREEFSRAAAGCHGLLTLLTDRVDAELLKAAPDLVIVSNMATGYDNIDLASASRRRVLVTRTPGVLSETVADFTFALLLAAARRVAEADRYVRAGRWKSWGPSLLLGRDVYGATLGIVGLGGVGSEVAKRARGFGMRLLYHSRTKKPALEKRYRLTRVSLDQLLRDSDFVTLHVPLTEATRGMIGRRELRTMKDTAILINTGRGDLVDRAALVDALKWRRIGGAALDVTSPEPLPADDPLLQFDNVTLAPHIASASVETRSRMAGLAVENLLAALDGRLPKDTVNPKIGKAWRAARRSRLGDLA